MSLLDITIGAVDKDIALADPGEIKIPNSVINPIYNEIIKQLPSLIGVQPNIDWFTGFHFADIISQDNQKYYYSYMTGHTDISGGMKHYFHMSKEKIFDILFSDKKSITHDKNLTGALKNGDSADPNNITNIYHDLTDKFRRRIAVGIVDINTDGYSLFAHTINCIYGLSKGGFLLVRLKHILDRETLDYIYFLNLHVKKLYIWRPS